VNLAGHKDKTPLKKKTLGTCSYYETEWSSYFLIWAATNEISGQEEETRVATTSFFLP
jgi:hypothetical protein